jgi:pullulanase
MLDVVTNLFGYGAAGASDSSRVRSTLTGTCPDEGDETTRCLFGLPDLRTELAFVADEVVERTAYWAERFPIDGFRFDAAKHVQPALLARIHARAEEALSSRWGARGFLTVAEHWGAAAGSDEARGYQEAGAADTIFDFSFPGLVEGFLAGRLRAEALAHHLEAWHEADGPPAVHWLSTHDTPPLSHRLGEHEGRLPLAAFLQLSVRGLPLVTWGEELGRGGGPWPHNRSSMPWERLVEPGGERLHALWRALLAARRELPALRGRALRVLHAKTDDEGATLVFLRGPDEQGRGVQVALRRGRATTIPLEAPLASRALVSWPPDDPAVVDEEQRALKLPADSAALWVVPASGPHRPRGRPAMPPGRVGS